MLLQTERGVTVHQHQNQRPARDAGFTLVELTVGMLVIGALLGLSTSGWTKYQRSVEHRNSAQQLVSALRNAQQASLAEAVTYCVAFDTTARTYQVWKFACGGSGTSVKGPTKTASSRITLAAPAFIQPNASTANTLSFFPRGSATKGSVKLNRSGSSRAYTVSVEGLTGRVSLSG